MLAVKGERLVETDNKWYCYQKTEVYSVQDIFYYMKVHKSEELRRLVVEKVTIHHPP